MCDGLLQRGWMSGGYVIWRTTYSATWPGKGVDFTGAANS